MAVALCITPKGGAGLPLGGQRPSFVASVQRVRSRGLSGKQIGMASSAADDPQKTPKGSPPRPTANREGSSVIGAPPDLPERAPGGRASHLGKIQTAQLTRITPALTAAGPFW